MGARYPTVVKNRAQELWEGTDYTAIEILEVLNDEVESGTLKAGALGAPNDPDLIYKWKQRGHWGGRGVKADDPTAESRPYGVTGIEDPIWHLAKWYALKFAWEMASRDNPPQRWEIIVRTITQVNKELRPGAEALRRLNPLIREHIKDAKRLKALMEEGIREELERARRKRGVSPAIAAILDEVSMGAATEDNHG